MTPPKDQGNANGAAALAAARPRRAHGMRVAAVAAAAVLMSAGMAWLSVSSRLAANGRLINELESERAALLERRAESLTAYAAASDPRAIEDAARALGFAPAAAEPLGIAVAPALADAPGLDPNSPLAIMRRAVGPAAAGDDADARDMPALLLSVGAAERAHADEIAPAEAAGP